jgi:uncharacterized membrane protein HdeD (DUF308 family)
MLLDKETKEALEKRRDQYRGLGLASLAASIVFLYLTFANPYGLNVTVGFAVVAVGCMQFYGLFEGLRGQINITILLHNS